MAPKDEFLIRLAKVSAALKARNAKEEKALAALEKTLARDTSLPADPDGIKARRLSIERASWYDVQQLSPDRLARIDTIVEAAASRQKDVRYRIFRRETPQSNPLMDLATPAWGRGAAVDQTLGPFTGVDGREFWFDFYRLVRLVPLYMAGDPRPAVLFYLSQLRLKPGDRIPVGRAIGLLKRKQYPLAGSSFWIRADLLSADAPAGTYVGLRIAGGRLTFTPPPIEKNGQITLPPGGQLTVDLRLDQPEVENKDSEAGIDAAQATLKLPNRFVFRLKDGKLEIIQLAAAQWKLYGQKLAFRPAEVPSPAYEPALQSILIPYSTKPARLKATESQSPFATFGGEAKVARAGWALPVAAIDTENPVEAAGTGALAVLGNSDLQLGWQGLRDGPIALGSPWIALWPGLILITDTEASNRYAHQYLRLWKDADSDFRSEILLRYSDQFTLIYSSAAAGTEAILTQTNAEARLDRPVDVKGTPLPIHTMDSQLLLSFSDSQQLAYLYDDNILIDSLAPDASWPVTPGAAISLAIRNALFTITPVNSLFLFASLRDAEMVEQATLLLGMGLYGLLPTLPDPYAANVSWLRRQTGSNLRGRRATMLLVAAVAWQKAASDEENDQVTTNFAFAPLGGQEKDIQAWSQAAAAAGIATTAQGENFFTTATRATSTAARSSAYERKLNEEDWNQRFRRFYQEQFALLDVSSNADQMGVSFAWFNPRSVGDDDYIFYEIYRPKSPEEAEVGPYPLQVRGLDLSAQSRFVRAFTTPQVSWEPLFTLPNPQAPPGSGDPPNGLNLYPNDGGPTRLFNNSVELVPIAPIPVTEFLVEDFEERTDGFTGALFTLPFGMRAFAEFSRENQFLPTLDPARLSFNRPEYREGSLRGGIQLRTDAPPHPQESPIFKGGTLQLNNVLRPDGFPAFAGTLGDNVGFIFNQEFFYDGNTGNNKRGVPLTRIDFSGYGASVFSHWQNPNAAIAATSQSRFDVYTGRTGHEVVQVRSLLYPWGVRVVRTITIFRTSSGYVFRYDSGWQAESDGLYDFRYRVYDAAYNIIDIANPYEFHPGSVRGVFRVRNIRETETIPKYETTWTKQNGDPYVDAEGILRTVDASTPANEKNPPVVMQPVYFDADVQIDDVITGALGGLVPSRRMLGYVQLAPRGEPLPPSIFAALLSQQFGALGGPVDCIVDIGKSGQQMRLSRVDVNASKDGGGQPIFASAARGSVILPKDGSWSVVQHNQGTGEVSPLAETATVPLIRRGKLNSATQATDAAAGDLLRLADPIDLVKAPDASTRNYGLLQSTDTQKALFRLPSFKKGVDELLGAPPEFADAYRMLNSAGIFPNVEDALPLNLGGFKTRIIEEGYKLLDQADPDKVFEQILPEGPLYLINEDFIKLYVDYAKKDKDGNKTSDGKLQFGLDSAATELSKKWLSKVNDIGMVLDLGPFQRLVTIKGKFDAEKGAQPGFIEPEIEFSDALEAVYDILQILLMLQGGDYQGALAKGLEVAMSNSPDSWNYAFHARKEIPLVKFPPGPAYDNPTNPLKLECGLAVGVYFNEVFKITDNPSQLIPSAGGFLDFYGRLSVMCVSVAAATVYATGSVDLRIAADIKTGPSLDMKFGFGAEITVGLPVVGTVSLLFMVGVEIYLGTTELAITAFLLFRGRAEILGGIVTVTITIEAKGTYRRQIGPPDVTNMEAQVTFGLDISIFLVINISFSESWQETRQIA